MILQIILEDYLMNKSRFVSHSGCVSHGIRSVESQSPVEVRVLFLNLVELVHVRSFLQSTCAVPEGNFTIGVHRVEEVEDV